MVFLNLKSHKNKRDFSLSEVIKPWHSTKTSPWIFCSGSFPWLPHPEVFYTPKIWFETIAILEIFNPSCQCKFWVEAHKQPDPTKRLIQNTKAYHTFLLHHPKNQLFHRFTVKKGFTWNRRAATIVFFAPTNVLVEFRFSVLRDEGFQTVHIIELDTSEIMSALGAMGSDVKFWRNIVSLHCHLQHT